MVGSVYYEHEDLVFGSHGPARTESRGIGKDAHGLYLRFVVRLLRFNSGAGSGKTIIGERMLIFN